MSFTNERVALFLAVACGFPFTAGAQAVECAPLPPMPLTLRAAEERFNVAFEHAPIAVSIIDLDGRVVDINAAGCEMLGYERAELVGTAAELTVHPDDRALAIQLTTAQLDGSSTPAEFRLLCRDGRVVPSLSHASLVVPTDQNQQPYVISLQSDISDRKRLEEELERRASHDALTGLRNRPSFTQHLDYALRRRHRPSVATMFIDLDDFKAVNDAHGHDVGDDVLVHVADRITETLRAGDVAARLGATPMQVALAWLLHRAPNILLIPGTSSLAHLHENLAAAQLSLPQQVLARLDAVRDEGVR